MSNAPSLNEDDILQQVEKACAALRSLADIVIEVAFGEATSARLAEMGPRIADTRRNRAEGMLDDTRSVLVEALTGAMPSGFVNSTDLAKALTARISDNDVAAGLRPASPLLTAMRRADAADRADRRACGESICAAIGMDLPLTLRGSL